MGRPSRGGSSTSAHRRSPPSPPSDRASPTSGSPGSPAQLTPSALRALAARHGIRPTKSLGQNFLIEPALGRRIAELARISASDRVVEVGAGLGSLTLALARSGAQVVAVEMDRRLRPALDEVVGGLVNVRIEQADALRADWSRMLGAPGPWKMVANLPYNVAVPVIMRVLDEEPRVERFLVMVQREAGERLAAGIGDPQYGAVSVRVALHAEAEVVRRVARTVFWPQPNVDSVLVSLIRRPPPVAVDPEGFRHVVRVAFQQRRKTMRGALVRMGLDPGAAIETLRGCGIEPGRRPEELGVEEFACLANRLAAR